MGSATGIDTSRRCTPIYSLKNREESIGFFSFKFQRIASCRLNMFSAPGTAEDRHLRTEEVAVPALPRSLSFSNSYGQMAQVFTASVFTRSNNSLSPLQNPFRNSTSQA